MDVLTIKLIESIGQLVVVWNTVYWPIKVSKVRVTTPEPSSISATIFSLNIHFTVYSKWYIKYYLV